MNYDLDDYNESNAIYPTKMEYPLITIDGEKWDITPSEFSDNFFLRRFKLKDWLWTYRAKNGAELYGKEFVKFNPSDLEYSMDELIRDYPEGLV